ncbi:hypothetical protein K474DRAFT_1710777 [Panus rudis PR-1116 ss-1]|nr:hypothetical protein K474DRAFT_1710777 [Panus rudis PR-1116 ss-1]
MPPTRVTVAPDNWEEVSSTNKVRCLPCTARYGETLVGKTGRGRHVTSTKHVRAIGGQDQSRPLYPNAAELLTIPMTSGTGSPGSSSVPPVENLCLAEQFSGPDVQTQPMNLPGLSLDSEYDPFADIFATGDGGICDADGRPIEISAGIEFGTSSIRLASQIREQIDTGMLDLSRTINMDNVDELFDDDLTLSSVAQRELLSGVQDSASDIENIEATLLGHADFEEGETGDARWSPYPSKTASYYQSHAYSR